MGSIDKALPHAGFYPDSQNLRSDGAKIRSNPESSKYFGTFFIARRFFLLSCQGTGSGMDLMILLNIIKIGGGTLIVLSTFCVHL